MAYTRYFAIRRGVAPFIERSFGSDNNGALELRCTLLGREVGGLCDEAEARIPAEYPEDWGIEVGDYLVAGYDSTHIWYNGIIYRVAKGGPGSTTITVYARGIEHSLKRIFPVLNFGRDYEADTEQGDPYAVYDNPTITQVSATYNSVVKTLWDHYVVGVIPGVAVGSGIDLDSSASSSDITYLSYDGGTSLYDIFNSLAERCGMSWGLVPNTCGAGTHTFFFCSPETVHNPAKHLYTYGSTCVAIQEQTDETQTVNEVSITGSYVDAIGQSFRRELIDEPSQDARGVRLARRSVPGIRRTIDAKKHAAAIFERRRAPERAYACECIAHDADLVYPGRTLIRVADRSGVAYNLGITQQVTSTMECDFGESAIVLSVILGEAPEALRGAMRSAITSLNNFPMSRMDVYDGATWTVSRTATRRTQRVHVVIRRAVVEAVEEGGGESGEDLGDIRIEQDAEGGNDTDPYREYYQGIPLPEGASVGDEINLEQYFEDNELIDTVTAGLADGVTGAGGSAVVDEDSVIKIVNYHLQSPAGRISLSNATRLRELGATVPADKDAAILEQTGGDGVPVGLVGQIVRVPRDNTPAIADTIKAVKSATYNVDLATLQTAFASTPEDAKIFDRVLDINNEGKVGLNSIVNVVIDEVIRRLYLQAATDADRSETVAAPNAVTKSNL